MEWTGQTVEICLGFLKNSAVTLTDMSALVAAMEVWRQTHFNALISSDVLCNQWYALSLSTSSSPSLIVPITVNTHGVAAAGTVPNNVSLVTTFQTDLRGRSYRGRAYLPGISTANIDSPTEADPTFAATATTVYQYIPTSIPAGWTHVVISNQNGGVVRTSAARTPVTGYRTEVRLDSQRRRLEGRGS
jgi:hypothetical protein